MHRRTLILSYGLAGASTLVFEVLAMRELTLVFGGTVHSVTTTLGVFMAGLGLGAAYFGQRADRTEKPLRLYGWTLLALAVFSVGFPALLALVNAGAIRWGIESAGARVALNFLLLLAPATLLGGALPLLTRALAIEHAASGRQGDAASRSLASLYATNNIGAALGSLLCGLVFVRYCGVQATLWGFAAINGALATLFLCRTSPSAQPAAAAPVAAESSTDATPLDIAALGVPPWVILALACVSGFTAFGYEILWVRSLVFLNGNSTVAAALVLAPFILGLGIGAAWYGRLSRQATARSGLTLFGVVSLGLFVWTLAGLALLPSIYDASNALYAHLRPTLGESAATLNAARLVGSGLLVLVPGIGFGLAFPVLARLPVGNIRILGATVGRVSAVNSLGCVIGAGVTGLWLLGTFGIARSFLVLGAMNAVAGLIALRLGGWRVRVWGPVAAAAIGLVWLLPPAFEIGRYRQFLSRDRGELLYYKEGNSGTVTVFREPDQTLLLSINGTGEVPTDFASLLTFRMLGHLGFLLKPNTGNVLVNALGGGIALGSVALHDKPVECVEICADVPGGTRLFGTFNHDVLSRPNVTLVINDGRAHIKRPARQFDLITADATHPGSGESWVLFTTEFYRDCRTALSPDGLMIQWLPMHQIAPRDYASVLRTFQTVFPQSLLFYFDEYTVIVGAKGSIDLTPAKLDAAFAGFSPEVRADLASIGVKAGHDVMRYLVAGPKGVARLGADGVVCTDDHSELEYAETRRIAQDTLIANVVRLAADYREHGNQEIATAFGGDTDPATWALPRRILAAHLTAAVNSRTGTFQDSLASYFELSELKTATADDPALHRIRDELGKKIQTVLTQGFEAITQHTSPTNLVALYSAAHDEFPANPELTMRLGSIYLTAGRVDDGIRLLEEAVAAAPKDAELRFQLGNAYLHFAKDATRAAAAYRRALELNPAQPGASERLQSLQPNTPTPPQS